MAKKSRKQKPKKVSQSSSSAPRPTERMMSDLTRLLNEQNFESADEANAFLAQLMQSGGGVPETIPQTPLDEAQGLIYQAWDTKSRAQRIKLARRALRISPDCVDAYVLLAETNCEVPAEACAFFERAVRVGERVLGETMFEEDKGHFWSIIETRPYMRARLSLAETLQEMGELEEAVSHMNAMLELNPSDNQGVRYLLISLLLQMNDDKAAEKLLKQFDGDWSVYWTYSEALLAFRQGGKSQKADALLKKAIDYNPHVPPYLIGKKKMPKVLPDLYSPRDENEAISYLATELSVWEGTSGAIPWVRETVNDDAS